MLKVKFLLIVTMFDELQTYICETDSNESLELLKKYNGSYIGEFDNTEEDDDLIGELLGEFCNIQYSGYIHLHDPEFMDLDYIFTLGVD
jgi:hypothetical protein